MACGPIFDKHRLNDNHIPVGKLPHMNRVVSLERILTMKWDSKKHHYHRVKHSAIGSGFTSLATGVFGHLMRPQGAIQCH